MNRRTRPTSVVISGDLGSGKSVVSRALADLLDVRRVSTGDIHREIAARAGITTLELNRRAERDRDIDRRVDAELASLGDGKDGLVLDSRLAWWFLPDSYKVHLVVHPAVAAHRLFSRGIQAAESYRDPHEALVSLTERYASERRRFRTLYGVDIARLANYDLVIDTSDANVQEVVAAVAGALEAVPNCAVSRPDLRLSPRRIMPTEPIQVLFRDAGVVPNPAAYPPDQPVDVGYAAPHFFVLNEHRRLSIYVRLGYNLVPGWLVAENGEEVIGGLSADDYFSANSTPGKIYDWEDAHGISFDELPTKDG